jgi:hypothetical protein
LGRSFKTYGTTTGGRFVSEQITAQEIIDKIVNEEIENPDSGFKDRLEEFRDWIESTMGNSYWDLIIFIDAFLLFFDFSDEEISEYIKGDLYTKLEFLNTDKELADSEEIMKRANNFVMVLARTGKIRQDYRYYYALFRLLYVLTGEEHFLMMMNLSPYEYDKENKEEPQTLGDIPMADHHVMFQ